MRGSTRMQVYGTGSAPTSESTRNTLPRETRCCVPSEIRSAPSPSANCPVAVPSKGAGYSDSMRWLFGDGQRGQGALDVVLPKARHAVMRFRPRKGAHPLQSQISLSSTKSFELREALLIYRTYRGSERAGPSAFVTKHSVTVDPSGGPSLGAGFQIQEGDLLMLCAQLGCALPP